VKVLVTGGAGFIGSNFVRYLIREQADWEVVNLDSLTYAGNLENLKDVEGESRYRFVRGDVSDRAWVDEVGAPFDAIVHFAAESHVDRSIIDASAFISTNIAGTQNLLDWARAGAAKRFVQVSTDEVYGSLGPVGTFTEQTALAPNSPYSASKTAADLLCRAAFHTHGQDVVITRCSNNYGPHQFPEKLIPLIIANALEGKELPVYGDGGNVRDWIHVVDHCEAVFAVLAKGRSGEVYNIGASNEWTNLDIVKTILSIVDRPESLIRFVKDRPGHDRRYAIDSSKIQNDLGWTPRTSFEKGLRSTTDWYLANREWLERVRSGAYLEYYERWYGGR
jgi:dTDP-glucose 4,6-dehydratase